MQFPESWLREFCNPPLNTQQLAELLTMSGMEVEELRPVAPPFHGIVIAEILEATQHPNAEKLRVLQPDDVTFVDEAVRLVVAELGATPLIGFAGAPFTLASYLIEGDRKSVGRERV